MLERIADRIPSLVFVKDPGSPTPEQLSIALEVANTLELAIPAEAVRHGPPPHGHAIPGNDRVLRRGVGPQKKDPPITIVGRSKNHIG